MVQRSLWPRGGVAVAALLVILGSRSAWGAPSDTELVSVAPDGSAAGGVDWYSGPSISADGRYVAFSAPEWTTGSLGGGVFVRDRLRGIVERVSIAGEGPSISADGHFVVFSSTSDKLVAGDTNEMSDVFVYDRQSAQTRRVSISSAGAQSNLDSCCSAAISGNGRFVAFLSAASNLVPNDTNDAQDVFVHDLQSGTTERVNVTSDERQVRGFTVERVSLSRDGRFVAFQSDAREFVPDDPDWWPTDRVFVRDRLNGVTEKISGEDDGQQAAISADGRYVAFSSGFDVYVVDRATGTRTLASESALGGFIDGFCRHPSISADGRYVAFTTDSGNVVSGDTNDIQDVFVRDTVAKVTRRVSVATNGAQGNGSSGAPAVSGNGLFVAFDSEASNLAAADTNGMTDVFVHEWGEDVVGPETMSYLLGPQEKHYGDQTIGTYRLRRFRLTNTGNVPLPIAGISIIGTHSTSFHTKGCGRYVPVAAYCDIPVVFHPVSLGDKTATLRVAAGDNDVRTRPMSGTGVPGRFTVSPTSLAFGSVKVGSSSTQTKTIAITNTGRAWLPLTSIVFGGERPGQFIKFDDCGNTLRAGRTCTAQITFRPTLEGQLAALFVVTAGGGTTPKSVPLAGTGVPYGF
jgi:Tol biopolymer transport system component